MPPEPPPDALIRQELDAIVERLAALASGGGDVEKIGEELGAIRAELQLLARDNAEVGARLGETLGLGPADERFRSCGAGTRTPTS